LLVNLLLHLFAQLRDVLQLLNACLMSLKRGLNRLCRALFPLGQLFEALRVLLFLLQQQLIILAGLLGLLDQLLNDLLALLKRLLCAVVGVLHGRIPPLI